LPFLFFSICAEFTEVSPSALQTDDDPLMNAVNLLEENWISIQETFELVSRILLRLFAGLWPKKRLTVLKDNLTELAKSFDTTEDPTLQLKGLSIKRGAEGAIALSLAHGTDFDWERVSFPHGRRKGEEVGTCIVDNDFSFGSLCSACCTTSSGKRSSAPVDFWRGSCRAPFYHGAQC
jgi:hypothetical protein